MRLFSRITRLSVLVALALIGGCRNSMRVAHLMTEAEGIGRNLDALDRTANGKPQPAPVIRPEMLP